MKTHVTRLLSLLLALVLVGSMMPAAMAASYDGAGETEPSSSGDALADLPDPIEGYDHNDPDNPYPYGLPVTDVVPEDVLAFINSGISGFATMAADNQGNIPDEMWDNTILRALEYTGYDLQKQKDNGQLYQYKYIGSRLLQNDPDVLTNIGYWSSGSCPNGDETIDDPTTVTGKAPKLSYFESNGLVCASFVTYYLCNYLPNIEGVDTSVVYEKAKEYGKDGRYENVYYLTSVALWKNTLDALSNEAGSGVTKYTDESTAYDNLVPGDVVVFAKSSGTLAHVGIYAGEYDLYNGSSNLGTYHFLIHVGNSRGPEISIVEWMASSSGDKASWPIAWYHLDFNDIQETGFIEVNKKDPNGNALAGAYFTATNTATQTPYIIGPTDSTGYAISGELPLGTYTVVESVFPEGYQASGESSWTVTLTADTPNMTITIDAVNELTKGSAKIVKTATNGGSVAGWHFTVKDASGNLVGNYVTDSTGVIALNLVPGTYTVTETDGNYKYWVNDPNPTKTLTVKAGETATVTFQNQFRGQAQIVKTATNGGTVEGWHFTVKNASGTVIGNYVTDSSGIITLDLEPGTYTVIETDGAYEYWVNDPQPSKTVTVKAGETAKVTFTNQWLGKAQIIKKATNGGSVAGWHFTVKDTSGNVVGNYVTDSSGIIALNLTPGTYTVTETDAAYEYWNNDPNPTKTLTVKAGQTASVTFTNSWFGKAQIIKKATNGGSVAGWHFEVRDSSGNVVGNYTTDTTGIITLDLEPGTYSVTETDGAYEYWHNDPNPIKTVTVKAGVTASVTFENQWIGKAQIVKTATNGGSVAGWHFEVRDASGNVVGSYVTDSTGIITIDLQPGQYTVVETDGEYPYWHNDPNPSKTVTVKAGETSSVTFENQWVGKAKIIKVLSNPEAGTVAGWSFTIYKLNGSDAQCVTTVTTGEDGTITYDLEPGEYLITEELDEDSMWECTSGLSQTITVTAGRTAEVSFTNTLRPGKIQIQKVDTQGQSLAGVEFLLEWSTDGVNWQPVTFTDATAPQIGGCTTEGVTDGKLKSDASGAVVFEGLYPLLQYRLTETATLDGYQLLPGTAYEGELPLDEDFTVTLTVVNAEVFTLPKTGSKSLVLMPIALVLCLVTCAGALVLLRKKEGQ